MELFGLYEGAWTGFRIFRISFCKGTPCFYLLLGKDDGLILKKYIIFLSMSCMVMFSKCLLKKVE